MSTEVLDRAKVLATGADVRGKTAVEAAILTYRNAVAEWEHDDPISGSGKDAERRQCDAYIALLAAISDATAAATEAFKRGMRRVFKCSAHEVDPTKAWGCPDCLAELRRATAAPPTVGGLLATAREGDIIEFDEGSWWMQVMAFGGVVRWRVHDADANGWHPYIDDPSSWHCDELVAFWLTKPARLVPPDIADLDPATRGPLPKGGDR